LYFANYTQDNTWYFTDILTDVRDNPRFLDAVVQTPTGTVNFTKNGFRKFLSLYRNGSGSTTIFSGVLGSELKLSDRLRADVGIRYEYNDFVQSAENVSTIDLDGNANTPYDAEQYGNGSFRHFNRSLDDWAGSIGLNYALNERVSLYAQGSRAYKMPALDEFLDAQAQGQVDVFEARRTVMAEAGVKFSSSRLGFTVNGFWGELTNIVGQGLEVNPVTQQTEWVTRPGADNRSYGAEIEVSTSPARGLNILGSGTFLKTETIEAAGSALTAGGVPTSLANLSATYTTSGLTLLADWHTVGSRDLVDAPYNSTTGKYDRYVVVGELKAYSYLNLGASYRIPGQAITLAANLLNVTQSQGLEEGNPRLPGAGGQPLFLARPILPRRLSFALTYNF
jgi:outer membrane receptor protein involved in Fe transport